MHPHFDHRVVFWRDIDASIFNDRAEFAPWQIAIQARALLTRNAVHQFVFAPRSNEHGRTRLGVNRDKPRILLIFDLERCGIGKVEREAESI